MLETIQGYPKNIKCYRENYPIYQVYIKNFIITNKIKEKHRKKHLENTNMKIEVRTYEQKFLLLNCNVGACMIYLDIPYSIQVKQKRIIFCLYTKI